MSASVATTGAAAAGAAAAELAAADVLGHENDDSYAFLTKSRVLLRRNACFCKTERFVSTESKSPAPGAKFLVRLGLSAGA